MRSRLLHIAGPILFALTVLAFVGLPFWQFRAINWLAQQQSTAGRYFDVVVHSYVLVLYLPLVVVALLWSGFLMTRLPPLRPRPPYSDRSEGRLTKVRGHLLIAAGAVALAATVLVEWAYIDWVGGAALGSNVDESDSALYHFYEFIEIPQLFLVLLWSAFLALTWLNQGRSPAVRSQALLPIGCLLLAVTGLVWMEYATWMAGAGMVTVLNKPFSPAIFRALQALPALFVACLWIWFSGLVWFIRSPADSRG